MHRRIMIILAATGVALAVATAPAGAAGCLELYAYTNYGTPVSYVGGGTVQQNLNQCVTVLSLTGQDLTSAQSTKNHTNYTIKLYSAAGCSLEDLIITVNPNTNWAGDASTATYVKPTS